MRNIRKSKLKMVKCRILFKKNKTICVVYPAPKCQKTYEEIMTKANKNNLPYKDIDSNELPSRDSRNKWTHDGKKIIIAAEELEAYKY